MPADLLPHAVLREVHLAALSAGIEGATVAAGLDRRLVGGLRTASSPSAQIWEDLVALNRIPMLADGSVPLRVWLEDANLLAGLRPEAAVFQRALASIGGRESAVQDGASGPVRAAAAVPSRAEASAPSASETALLPSRPPRADVVIVTALKEEYDEARKVDDGALEGWTIDRTATGFEVAFRAYRTKEGRSLRVALTWATRMRTTATADAAGRLVDRLGARCVAMSGVCAGRRGKVHPGDVILGSLLYSYDQGAVRAEYDSDGTRHERFQAEPDPYQLHEDWLHRAQAFQLPVGATWLAERPPTLAAQCDWVLDRLREGDDPVAHADSTKRCPAWSAALERLRRLGHVSPRGKLALTGSGAEHIEEVLLQNRNRLPAAPPVRVHVAPIATGNHVMRDPLLFERLSDAMRSVLGVEMEAAAIAAIAHARKLPWMVMKGVMDHADQDKDDQVKPFAARAAAECLIAFLRENLPAGEPAGEGPSSATGSLPLPPDAGPGGGLEGRETTGRSPGGEDGPPDGEGRPAPPDERLVRYLAVIEADVTAHLEGMPAATASLAQRLGVTAAPGALPGAVMRRLVHFTAGKDAVRAFHAVDEQMKDDATRSGERRALRSMLFQLLPLTTDWRPYVVQGRAALNAGAKFVDLPLGSPTMAEAILAGIDCRRCQFVTDTEMGPAGGALIRKPAAEELFFDPTRQRLVEATVGLLAMHFFHLAPDDPALRDHPRNLHRVNAKLQYHREVEGDEYLPRWLLLDDGLLAHVDGSSSVEHEQCAKMAVTALGNEFPHLRILRLGKEIPSELICALHIGGIWRKRL